MRSVHVVVHPEATHHVERVVGGWHDSSLTPSGRRAAASIAQALRSRIPDGAEVEVVSSDLLRARQTADRVAGLLGVEALLDRRLREKSYGRPREGRRSGWTGGSSRHRPPGTGWATTRAYGEPRPGRSAHGASTRPWTRSCGARAGTRSS